MDFSQFHWLRPEWLWAFLPVSALWLYGYLTTQKHALNVQQLIEPTLLKAMTQQTQPLASGKLNLGQTGLLLAWCLSIVALAGPSWEKLPTPANTNADALIIVLDMSYSMLSEDIQPSRLERSKFKVQDILNHRGDGYTALIAYAGDAHTVSPLTQDTNTVRNLLNPLTPLIMPAPGSRPDKALQLAQTLKDQAGLPQARVLLITDEIIEQDIKRIKDLPLSQLAVSILAVGTKTGAPINLPNHGFLRSNTGEIILPSMDFRQIAALGEAIHANVATISLTDQDWRQLIPEQVQVSETGLPSEISVDQWRDAGVWLCLALLPFGALAFRKGWLLSFFVIILLPIWPSEGLAFNWEALWKTPDQQAQAIYTEDPKAAAQLFKDPKWRAMAFYQAQDYPKAIELWTGLEGPTHAFNLGNAYAQNRQLNKAIAAYSKAIELQPHFPEAKENLAYVEKLLQQQKNENQKHSDPKHSEQENSQSASNNQDTSKENESTNNQPAHNQSENSQNQQASNSHYQSAQSTDKTQQQQSVDNTGEDTEKSGDQSHSDTTNKQKGNNNSSAEADINERLKQENESPNDTTAIDLRESDVQSQQMPNNASFNTAPSGVDDISEDNLQQQLQNTQRDLQHTLPPEEYQALQQWLNRIPEDPSGLLERKFLYEYKKRQNQHSQQESKVW